MKKRERLKVLARERVDLLTASALKERNQDLAKKQARLAKKIAMRFRLRLPYGIRQLYCKRCKLFIIPGRSARVRMGRSNTKGIRITCLKCGHVYRKVLAAE
ncbi:MAG: ribonuclease P protein component 4 [Nitrososphaera sp.]